MPSPEVPKEIGEIPGISEKSVQQLENDPDLLKVLLVQEESGKSRLIAVLKEPKKSITMATWDCLIKIGNEAEILWSCIPNSQEENFTSQYHKVICLLSKEPDSELPKHPIV